MRRALSSDLNHNSSTSDEDSEPRQEDYGSDTAQQQAIAAIPVPLPIAVPFDGSSTIDDGHLVQLSTAFNFTANLDRQPPDTLIISSDGTLFAAHSHRLLSVSNNHFGGLFVINADPAANRSYSFLVSEASDIFNVVMHTIYCLSSDKYQPSLDCVISAVAGLRKYGLTDLHAYLYRGAPLFNTFLHLAIQKPFEVFSFASREDLEDLAVDSSEHTLTVPLHHAPNDVMKEMDPQYLMRLIRLHSVREIVFKGLLDASVRQHATTAYCSAGDREVVIAAYKLSRARLYFAHSPLGVTAETVGSFLSKQVDDIACLECKVILQEHIHNLCAQWQLCERTI